MTNGITKTEGAEHSPNSLNSSTSLKSMASIIIAVVPAVLIFCALYLTLLLVKVIQEDQGKPRRTTYSPAKVRTKPKPRPSVKRQTRARVNACLQSQLLGMVSNDQELADRLVASNRRKFSGRSEDWYWEKTICDLERDRR